jgi:hypothetical protein
VVVRNSEDFRALAVASLYAAAWAVSDSRTSSFSVGPLQVLLTLGLIAVIALPGMLAARVSPRAILQE